MDLGLFMHPIQNRDLTRHPADMLEECREAIIFADKMGFDEAWVGEHQSSSIELVTNPLQFCASLIPVTERIKFATAVISLPIYHPAKVAVDVAMFDHMSRGRFIMGVGPGAQVSDLELFDVLDKNRGEMVMESIDMIHKIWSSDPPYDIEGKYWNVKIKDQLVPQLGFGPMLKPYQKLFPPVVTSVMSPKSKSAAQAGERGWGILSGNFAQLDSAATHWEQYVIGCERAGRRPDRNNWRICRSILVAESDSEARDYLAEENNAYECQFKFLVDDMKFFNLIGVLKADPSVPDEAVTPQYCVDTLVMSGSPSTVLDKLVDLVDRVGGPFGTLVSTFKEWDKPEIHKTSMRLLSHEVMPKLRDYCGAKRAAD